MKALGPVLLAALAMGAGVGSFLATRAVSQAGPAVTQQAVVAATEADASGVQPSNCPYSQANRSPLASWLNLTPTQAKAMEHNEMGQEARVLNETLQQQRIKLVHLFETPGTTDEGAAGAGRGGNRRARRTGAACCRVCGEPSASTESGPAERLMGLCANTVPRGWLLSGRVQLPAESGRQGLRRRRCSVQLAVPVGRLDNSGGLPMQGRRSSRKPA